MTKQPSNKESKQPEKIVKSANETCKAVCSLHSKKLEAFCEKCL